MPARHRAHCSHCGYPGGGQGYCQDQLRDTLRALYRQRFEKVVALGPETQAARVRDSECAEAWVFGEYGPVDPDNFRSRIFGPLFQAAGLRKIRIHNLRHGYASLLIDAGKDLPFIHSHRSRHQHRPDDFRQLGVREPLELRDSG